MSFCDFNFFKNIFSFGQEERQRITPLRKSSKSDSLNSKSLENILSDLTCNDCTLVSTQDQDSR